MINQRKERFRNCIHNEWILYANDKNMHYYEIIPFFKTLNNFTLNLARIPYKAFTHGTYIRR